MAKLAAHPSGLHTAKERERALRWLAGLAEADRARILASAAQAITAASIRLPGVDADNIPYISLLLEIRRFGFDAIRRRGYHAAGDAVRPATSSHSGRLDKPLIMFR